jgi:hypothetical protein
VKEQHVCEDEQPRAANGTTVGLVGTPEHGISSFVKLLPAWQAFDASEATMN